MAHGFQDFGLTNAPTTTFRCDDMGELAARLGSINTFDRRGDTVWMDDFEATVLHWNTATSGVGASVALSTVSANYDNNSVLLTGGSDVSKYAQIYKDFPLPKTTKLGAECAFTMDSNVQGVWLIINFYDGTNRNYYDVYVDAVNLRIRYINSLGILTTLASGLSMCLDTFCYHHLKLVIDYSTQQYLRVIFNDVEYDMSGLGCYSLASATSPRFRVEIQNSSQTGENSIVYVDSFILTQNEP